MANPARFDGVPPWTVENYVPQNPGRGRKSPQIARLEHINGDEPYSTLWARVHKVENGYIESFNGKLRDECLNANQFLSIDDARSKIEAWRADYNLHRPHSGLGNVSPAEWLKRFETGDQRAADFSF